MLTGACEQVDEGPPGMLVINEIVSANEGAGVDEIGEADDYIELANPGQIDARLDQFVIRDSSGAEARLPRGTVPPGGVVVLWADDSPEQGRLHLPFKVSSSGDELDPERRWHGHRPCRVPELEANDPSVGCRSAR